MLRVARLCRHPIKGFTPEEIDSVALKANEHFPCDRLYAVEDGPCGYDPSKPEQISKFKFAVLARDARIAKAKTQYNEVTGVLQVSTDEDGSQSFRLFETAERAAFCQWLASFTNNDFDGPLQLISSAEGSRFMDSKSGFVSLINEASVAAISDKLSVAVSATRFRGNILFSGGAAWCEDAWTPGSILRLGDAELEVLKPIERCRATHADPQKGEYNLDIVPALRLHCDRLTCGIYAKIVSGGRVALGDQIEQVR